jgi:hypothetical protein
MTDTSFIRRKQTAIAALAIAAIVVHLVLRFGTAASETAANWPLWVALVLGGGPLVWDLLVKLFHREFGSDLLAGISIVTSVILGEYLAGVLVVLMLSGGERWRRMPCGVVIGAARWPAACRPSLVARTRRSKTCHGGDSRRRHRACPHEVAWSTALWSMPR